MEFESLACGSMRAKNQELLAVFVRAALATGPRFMRSAWLAKDDGRMDHYAQAKQSAIRAANTVRAFMVQITDDAIRSQVGKELVELDQLVSEDSDHAPRLR
jgi:hypothetical protein